MEPLEEKKLKQIKDIVWIYKISTNLVRIGFGKKALTLFQNKSFLPFFLCVNCKTIFISTNQWI